ncbi:MAG TPA: hypothetical protein VMF69_09740, partial [Gemmataceae bacterium]|nr:hypothetical protein [Gemmataceae bacterium]
TYTLTVTNNESTAANVTLTDVLDPNTTYTSSSGANWTITGTPSTSSPGGTFTATISLAANSSATLTITVSVNATAPGNATLSNTASISPTGNNAAGMRSVTMDTQTQGATNITSEVGIIRSPVLPDPFDGRNAYVQGDLLFNWSGSTFTGPIALVLVGLPSNVTLTNASGYYDGSPYINIVAPGESWQAGLWDFLITILEFSTTNPADIKYTPEILQGI